MSEQRVGNFEAIPEKGSDNFATSIYEVDYDGLLIARCNQNGRYPHQVTAILNGLNGKQVSAELIAEQVAEIERLRAALASPDRQRDIPEGCARLYVGHGQFALCDWEDWPTVAGYWWRMSTKTKSGVRYAQTHSSHNKTERTMITMHRLIMSPSDGQVIDHINGDGLDNRRSNLRLVTTQQNSWNMRPVGGSSRFKGVSFRQDGQAWRAYITKDGKRTYLGNFASEIEAARAYNFAAKEAFGEYAKLNDIG